MKKAQKVSKREREGKKDGRFSKAAYDPQFISSSAKVAKTKIDSRFAKMMTDPSFQIGGDVDRYGRKTKKAPRNVELEDYYYQEQQEAQEQVQEQEQVEGGLAKWMQEYDEESSEMQEEAEEELKEQDGGVWSDEQDVIKNEKVQATCRLALCNYDWMNVNSKDLMILFSSFKPVTGFIRSVSVYQSNYGREQLEKEQIHGPQGIWNEVPEETSKKNSWKDLYGGKEQPREAMDENKLRAYQKNRLKYYYAVIVCDSTKTADQIYRECDGNQFENSNLAFDLRFVPDDTVFDAGQLKEQCNQMPVNGEVKNFVNRAMGHSEVRLTWEDPELSTPASLKRKNWNRMTDEQLDKVDWSLYIDEKEIQEQEDMRELMSAHGQQKEWQSQKQVRNRNDDIEITFESGFKGGLGKKSHQFESLKKQKKSLKEKRREADAEKAAKQKQREGLELIVENRAIQNFQPDVKDERFTAVYSDPQFSIDPVDSHFDHRKIGNVFQEVVKRNKVRHGQ